MGAPKNLRAGSGGMDLELSQTSHSGRKAVLLTRDSEFKETHALLETMGIFIVETIVQSGLEDPRHFFGKGRLKDVANEITTISDAHPWRGVDLVIIHTNASPRQLVTVSNIL